MYNKMRFEDVIKLANKSLPLWMSTYSENRLITGKKSFTFLKSNVILLKLQKEEKKSIDN